MEILIHFQDDAYVWTFKFCSAWWKHLFNIYAGQPRLNSAFCNPKKVMSFSDTLSYLRLFSAIPQTSCSSYHRRMKYTSLPNHDFLEFAWCTEQQSLLLFSIVAVLQLTLIENHRFPIKLMVCKGKYLHCNVSARVFGNSTVRHSVIFEHLRYVFNSMRRNYRVNYLSCLCPLTCKFSGFYEIWKYCFE
jgi:hypothetical protein